MELQAIFVVRYPATTATTTTTPTAATTRGPAPHLPTDVGNGGYQSIQRAFHAIIEATRHGGNLNVAEFNRQEADATAFGGFGIRPTPEDGVEGQMPGLDEDGVELEMWADRVAADSPEPVVAAVRERDIEAQQEPQGEPVRARGRFRCCLSGMRLLLLLFATVVFVIALVVSLGVYFARLGGNSGGTDSRGGGSAGQ